MNKRLSIVPVFCVMILLGLLWGIFWQKSSQAATFAASLDVPFFSQTALRNQTVSNGSVPSLGNSDLPLWEYGCGVASLAMVYRHYGVDTDVARLNDTLRTTGGFVGGLLAWSRSDAFVKAGAPWVKGIERMNTTRPLDYRARIDAALDNGEPVIAYLNSQHYVVLVGKEDDSYRINDPWAVTADKGKNIDLDSNLLKKGGFANIRQLVFVSRQEYAPTNRVPVTGVIRDKYIASRGSQGPLGNPLQAQETLNGDVWQRFETGAIFAPASGQPVMLHGPVWEKFQAEGGVAELDLPRSDVYSYFVGPAVEWRAEFADASILWVEGERPNQARLINTANGIRAEYFANPNLSGQPAYSRYENDLLFDWRDGAPGPWVDVDNFSARYTQTFQVGGLGWRYNFVLDTDSGVRVTLDGKLIVDAWEQPGQTHKFNRNLWRGQHELVVDYRHTSGEAHLRFARGTWPATPAFASKDTVGSFETLPVSVAATVPDLGTPIAQATATAAGVIATLTAEVLTTPAPDTAVADATATAIAMVRATAATELPVDLRGVYIQFGLEFVRVPAGEFLMGSTEAQVDAQVNATLTQCYDSSKNCIRPLFENQMPQHNVTLEEFWIGKTEVTNAQYKTFVEAGGYEQPGFWTVAGWENLQQTVRSKSHWQKDCWGDDNLNGPDQPVVCVNWFEAVAYANWLALESGLSLRLPTEAEWEKAARGIDGRLWPWGNEPPDGSRLNFCDATCERGWKDESVDDGHQFTAPVGSYPAGASPYGVLDMAGNVWEWTSTASGFCNLRPSNFAYPYQANDGREDMDGRYCRILRGGGWNGLVWSNYPDITNTVFRYGFQPAYLADHFGFRVVVSMSVPVHSGG